MRSAAAAPEIIGMELPVFEPCHIHMGEHGVRDHPEGLRNGPPGHFYFRFEYPVLLLKTFGRAQHSRCEIEIFLHKTLSRPPGQTGGFPLLGNDPGLVVIEFDVLTIRDEAPVILKYKRPVEGFLSPVISCHPP